MLMEYKNSRTHVTTSHQQYEILDIQKVVLKNQSKKTGKNLKKNLLVQTRPKVQHFFEKRKVGE